jgi:hypothetical protein
MKSEMNCQQDSNFFRNLSVMVGDPILESGWSLRRKLVDKTRPREAAHLNDAPRAGYLQNSPFRTTVDAPLPNDPLFPGPVLLTDRDGARFRRGDYPDPITPETGEILFWGLFS